MSGGDDGGGEKLFGRVSPPPLSPSSTHASANPFFTPRVLLGARNEDKKRPPGAQNYSFFDYRQPEPSEESESKSERNVVAHTEGLGSICLGHLWSLLAVMTN